MISPELTVRIRHLFFAEHWKIGTIAAELGIHWDTVRTAIESDRFNNKPDQSVRQRITDPYLELIRQTLDEHPRLRATRIYEMVKTRGYTGSIIQLRRVVRTLRPLRREAFLRLQTFPGEQAQVDWACFGTIRIGRATRRLSCFVMTLSWSRAIRLEFFTNQSLENLLVGHVNAFRELGGVPRHILYDNMASVVSERLGDGIRFHPRLLELCAHYHFEARPCRPARGNEKGRVERAIQYIRHSFFAARSYSSLEDLNRQAQLWVTETANQRRWREDDSRLVSEVIDEERMSLLRLPQHDFETDLVTMIRSDKTIYVRYDLNDYSIPPTEIGKQLTLIASQDRIRLLDGMSEIASHPRSYDRHARIDDPRHIEQLVEQKRKATGSTVVGRLRGVVPAIDAFIEAAFARGESISLLSRHLSGLFREYGAAELNAAIEEALRRQTPTVGSVNFILQQRQRAGKRQLPPVDLSKHPHLAHLADLAVTTHALEKYDELAKCNDQGSARSAAADRTADDRQQS